ncbi:uncharacterized protein FRV6_16845 [Fusarium oxysporum]|uniref:Uncharacterized protein n=1 Tax=Fusarium oxysporum TaxID=5507 RepID=A0A2H3TVU8_FUSOX|nr:uncharacterized protein FRV6_16845 [Fusarium oxysporum]
MESGDVTERVTLLSHQLSMVETSTAYDAITRMQLQENISTLEYENERLAQEARQQREDAVYHRDFFYRLLEATDQLNLAIADIHQDYIRTVNVSEEIFIWDIPPVLVFNMAQMMWSFALRSLIM